LFADTITVKGAGSSGPFKVKYFSGTTDNTASVVAGVYSIDTLGPAASRIIKLEVTVSPSATVGAVRSVLVTATSTGAGKPKDAVKARVKVS
jgi:hypothetical protein